MMAMRQMYAPELEAPTLDAMQRTVSMFAIASGKTLTAEEGFQLLTLWSMINKSSLPALVGAPEQPKTEDVQPVLESKPVNSPAVPVNKSLAEPASPAVMPAIEEITIPGVGVPLRKVQNFIQSDSKYWMPGYPWKINVVPFDPLGDLKAYYVHFQERPTQKQFDEHYALFLQGKCRVHVFESDGQNSRRITDEFCAFTERGDVNYASDETLTPRTSWRDGERFRIRFYDERIGKDNFVYYPNKPTKEQVNRLSTVKKLAFVEPRPLGKHH